MRKRDFKLSNVALAAAPFILAAAYLFTPNQQSSNRHNAPTETIEQIAQPIQEKPIKPINREYSASKDIVDFLKDFEALETETYLDQGGKPTICYGHLIKQGESFDRMTKEQCSDLFREDISNFEKAVSDYVSVDLTQNQYDALVSLSFNIGTRALKDSTLLRKLNDKDYLGAAEQFEVWNKVNGKTSRGLVKRRAKERDIFTEGVYDSNH